MASWQFRIIQTLDTYLQNLKYRLDSINQSINFWAGLSNKKLPQGRRKERKLGPNLD